MLGSSLELYVCSHDGQAPAVPIEQVIEQGQEVAVGRGPGNDLLLLDPERLISRFQARVTWERFDSVKVENISSSSSVMVGEQVLPPGHIASMGTSQRAVFGRFVLGLRTVQAKPVLPSQVIPDDFDVFAIPNNPEPAPALAGDSLDELVGRERSTILDDLPLRGEIIVPTQHAANLLDTAPAGAQQTDAHLDPLALLDGVSSGQVAQNNSFSLDHGLEVDSLFHLPVIADQPVVVASTSLLEELGDTAVQVPAEFIPASELKPESAFEVEVAEIPAPAFSVQDPVLAPGPSVTDPLLAPVTAVSNTSTGASDTLLMAAFARGCGVPEESLPAMSEAFMENLGKVFFAMTSGTVRLVQARSAAKHEMRAGVTIIATEGNNPLKFSPDGRAAIAQLLGNRFHGFMAPMRAIDDAFDDLAAHQVALLAGARSAMYDLAGRFSPEQLEKRCREPSTLQTILPVLRRSSLWDAYTKSFADIAGEAREELETLLEDAFARAYELEVERIYSGRKS